MPSIDPRELNDLASFATRGGLGKGVATTDCVAEQRDQLMFIAGDHLVLLREDPDCVWASCEGVVGWVKRGEVQFDQVAGSSSPRISLDTPARDDLPRTVLTAPSPPPIITELANDNRTLAAPKHASRRISSPFEFESPQQSPNIEQSDQQFFDQPEVKGPGIDEKRESVASIASSEVLGGIGGFMMDDSASEGDAGEGVEELQDVSPATASVETPVSPPHSPSPNTRGSSRSSSGSESEDWDIYGDYARDSMYAKRASKRASKMHRHNRESTDSLAGFGAVHARAALEGTKSPLAVGISKEDPETPKPAKSPLSPIQTSFSGRSIATELRMRIQKEREAEEVPMPEAPMRPPRRMQSLPMESGPVDTPTLMASPMPLEDTPIVAEPLEVPDALDVPVLSDAPISPSISQPPPPGWSPSLAAPAPVWTPGSPASPHSVAATRQAVDVVNSTPEGKRPRGLTLVGRMDSDLAAAKGPVPITFIVGGPEVPGMSPSSASVSTLPSIGLGLPSGRKSPVTPEGRARSPLSPVPPMPIPAMPVDIDTLRATPSRFPQRSVTSPTIEEPSTAGPRPGFLAARPRSRSFSASVSKAIRKTDLHIDTAPPMPKKGFFTRSPKDTPPTSPKKSQITLHPNTSTPSLPPSARSSSFSFSSAKVKTPRKMSRMLASPVSHKDYEDTVNAGGMDFELVQPKKVASVPHSPASMQSEEAESMTIMSSISTKILPQTDEWGFVKVTSPVPEIFMSRSAPGEHRAAEQKWLGIIATPMPAGGAPKKVRKLAVEGGIPSSLRGRVWAWFMAPSMSARVRGLYDELCSHEKPSAWDEQIEKDVAGMWSDHSIFCTSQSPGRADLRSLLRAYSNFAPSGYSTSMCLIAGTLLIHCVAEDAFWLLSGLVNTSLKEYYSKDGQGVRVDAGVFEGVLRGSEKEMSGAFKIAGVKTTDFIEVWYRQLFVRCLPWPTMLRVMDAVVSEGPRFLFVAALTILTLSRERIMALPRTKEAILGYLLNLPQDSLLLPEHFMKACEKVRFRDEDYQRLRGAVEKEMGLA